MSYENELRIPFDSEDGTGIWQWLKKNNPALPKDAWDAETVVEGMCPHGLPEGLVSIELDGGSELVIRW